jgi:hypothetical protein
VASGACELQIGMTKESADATMSAGVVTSKLTKKWVPGGRKERGRRVGQPLSDGGGAVTTRDREGDSGVAAGGEENEGQALSVSLSTSTHATRGEGHCSIL